MEKAKRSGGALMYVTLATLWRRKWQSALLAGMAALEVFASVALYNLAARQEAAIEDMVANSVINCVVTDTQGMNRENLDMVGSFVFMLTGQRHDRGCYLDEYVKNVRARSTIPLEDPKDTALRRILSFDSDSVFSEISGVKVSLTDGWTEEDFGRTEPEKICLISEGMETGIGEDGRRYMTVRAKGQNPLTLLVAGTVTGGPGNVVWIPFFLQTQPGVTEMWMVESCSFDIADNARLEECKAAIYETFMEPSLSAMPGDRMTFGVLVQDETYLNTLGELESNLATLRIILPILALLCAAIGFFASWLTVRGRVREFAVMRCLGVKSFRVFLTVFEEQVILGLAGAIVGAAVGIILEGSVSGGALLLGCADLAAFLAGSAAAALGISRVNVIKLMKEEE